MSRRGRSGRAAFALNAAWEVGQWPLYSCAWSPLFLAQAAGVDSVVTMGAAEAAEVVHMDVDPVY